MADTLLGMDHRFEDIPGVRDKLASVDYLADDAIAGTVYLADRLEKPILVEGPAGTGKTCLLYTSPSPRDLSTSRMPSSA